MKAGAARKLDPPAPDREGRTPESFLEEIRTALGFGAEKRAREITEQGLALYPDHATLQQYRHFLRPAGSRVVSGPNAGDPRPSYEWIKRHSGEYRGKWVALYKGELIVASESFNEILQAARNLGDPLNTILHFID
ncbi:MAG TPA: hypothetical protein VFC23_00160 [Thermoanaerobaculia bacterium]|nr:hypothetical protein [Thermoanaerobaculia bacterium]